MAASSQRILIVDDDPSVRRALNLMLSKQGFEVIQASDGVEAVRLWREVGKHDVVTFEEVEAAPPRRLVARIADPSLPYGGSWTYVVTPDGTGSRVTITENGVVYSPVFRFVSRFVFGHHATQEAYLRALGRRFGHETTPVRG